MNETKQLAQFITEIHYNDLSNEVIEKAKGLILDQLGCQLAFAIMPWSKGIYRYVCSKKIVCGESTVAYYGLKTSAEDAAFANATFGHGFEMDDVEQLTASHPGVVVIPPALAMGEQQIISGKEFITAIVAGYDTMLRIGLASRNIINRGFDTTPTNGTFGSTAVAGKILGFNTDLMVNALAIAADQSNGTAEFSNSGGSLKRLHAGFPAQAGIKAALLAQNGITGPTTAIEGKSGFCKAFAGEITAEEITAGLGKDYKIMLTGNKPYCCCAAQHTIIDATDKISKDHAIKPDDIAEIIVEQRQREAGAVGVIIETPDVISAQFSGRFGLALRLVKGSNGYYDYIEKNLKDQTILGLVKKIRYITDEKQEKLKVDGGAIVTIKLKDGSCYKEQVDYAKGSPQNPMLWPELEEKFRSLVSGAIPNQNVEAIIQVIKGLEELNNIKKLASLLVTDGKI